MSKKIISLLALSLLLTIASAYEANLVKTLFYLDEDNTFTQPFFQTKNNVIGYNVIAGETEALSVPHFTTINLQNTSASLFFENTMNACGQNNAIYLRMFYHSNTSTLVYYCTLNNTLLILDEDDYTVKNTVPVYTTGLFNETKIYAEGTSVVILGIANSYSYLPNSTATQLIKINLESMQVVRQVTFDKGLEDGEVVTAYTSGNLLSFVLTTQVNLDTNTVTSTIYSVVFAGNLYQLIQVTTFNYSFPQDIFYFNPSELATLDSYLVANNDKNLLFYTITGNLAYNFTDLQFVVQQTVEDYLSVNIPVYAMQYGSSTLYAQFTNTSIVQFSASGSSLNWHSLYQISASTNFVLGNQYNGDLLFATATNFNIIDLKTSQVTYTVQTALEDTTGIGLTNSTYIVYQLTNTATDSVTVFDLKTNLAIGAFNNHSSNVCSSYYDQVNNVYYYIEAAVRYISQCTVKFFDAKSLVTGDVFSYDVSSDYIACSETNIEHLQSIDQGHSPNFVISSAAGVLWKEYLIHTQTQDRLIAIWPNMIDISTYVFADYDNMTFYYLMTSSDENSTVEIYVYDENTNDLNLEDTYNISNIPNNKTQYGLQINSSTIAFISGTQCGLVNFAERTSAFYDFPNYANINVSSFQDVEGQTHLIISDMGGVESPSMLDMDGTVSKMPESNNYTQRAASAGASSFFLVDDFGAGVQAVRFYDSFSENPSDGRKQIELDYDYMIEDILQ